MCHPLVVPTAAVLLCVACSGGSGGSGGAGTVQLPDAGSTGGAADAGSASTCRDVVGGGGAVPVGSADYGGGLGGATFVCAKTSREISRPNSTRGLVTEVFSFIRLLKKICYLEY